MLHLGCGKHVLPGWINTDLEPRAEGVTTLDVTKPFPYDDDSMDLVFTEHLIEHITYPQGRDMLSECHRVLAPGGRIRVTTPDLIFLLGLFDGSALSQRYLRWSTEQFIPWAPYVSPAVVVNNFVRDWGHQFIYDEQTLGSAMASEGFMPVTTEQIGQSSEPQLSGLENIERMPEGFLILESLTLEGVCWK